MTIDIRTRDEPAIDAPGTGVLDVVRVGGRSVVRRAYATSPLRWLTPRNHGEAAWVYASSHGGGLVGGDTLQVRIDVGAGATAFVSSQASTKVYRSDHRSSIHLAALVAPEGHLVLWPDPVVCYADSTFSQTQRVELAAGASLLLVDTVSSGRRASGERWQFAEYASRLRVSCEGRPVLFDSTRLSAADGDLAVRMGRFDVLSVVALVGPRYREHARSIAARLGERPVERRADLLVSVAPIAGAGCLLRAAGRSIEQISAAIRGYLSFLPGLLGDDPGARKW